jgi:hypothetical protein
MVEAWYLEICVLVTGRDKCDLQSVIVCMSA